VEFLFGLYEQLTAPLAVKKAKKPRGKKLADPASTTGGAQSIST
jgi:hypothetical protein